MNARTPNDVTLLKINDIEREHMSRNRLGFHVYASRFVWNFRALHMEEQRRLVSNLLDESNVLDSDDISLDSTNSNINEDVKYRAVFKLACNHWQSYSSEMKSAWKSYAEVLNQRPVPGKLYSIPSPIGGEDKDMFRDNVLESLTLEWRKIVRVLKTSITRRATAKLSSRKYTFGSEVVSIQSQSFRDIDFSLLLLLSIFGGKDYSTMRADEIIKKTTRVTLLHIASQRRMDDLFTLSGLSATTFYTPSTVMTCSGKVNILTVRERNILGYIVDERNNMWKVKLENNETIWMPQLRYDHCRQEYNYDDLNNPAESKITMYWPIRLFINLN